jgi:site-specific DNA-methyltransferase (adenine-specific)
MAKSAVAAGKSSRASVPSNTIINGDCIAGMNGLPAGSVDLVFADPPFNIGFSYDVYDDRLERDKYLAWSHDWIAAVHRALKDDGAFWLAIGDEYAAELKVESQKIGFHSRSWVIWYYTFGVNCSRKFTRSHAHLFHFVKNRERFTFRAEAAENRIPSARQLVYGDKRANSTGRLPDDTWIIRPSEFVGQLDANETWSPDAIAAPRDSEQTFTLRPQDLGGCFQRTEDTWYFPRVAGTFKERAGFHGCQMPEQLLARIIRTCSEEGELVLDPFSGSATTAVVAKKLGRRHLAFDLSIEYVTHGLARLESTKVGDPLVGSAEPLASAPTTKNGRRLGESVESQKARKKSSAPADHGTGPRHDTAQLEMTLRGILTAFRETHAGYSADRVVADPELNTTFVDRCRQAGLVGEARTWNTLLFRLRKQGRLAELPTLERTGVTWEDCDGYLFASEIALEKMLDAEQAESLDEMLCDPALAATFDAIAAEYAPGLTPFEYRWAALKLRKQTKLARSRGAVLIPPARLSKELPIEDVDAARLPCEPGVYLLSGGRTKIYVGETLNLRERLKVQFADERRQAWSNLPGPLSLRTFATETAPAEMLAWQSCLVRKYKPRLNYRELAASE